MVRTNMMNDRSVIRLVQLALAEDVGTGDISSEALVSSEQTGHGVLRAKQSGVLAGTVLAALVFCEVDCNINCEWEKKEGEIVRKGDVIGHVRGAMRPILTSERTALNFLQRLSGVATLTRRYVNAVQGTTARILDTRKTLPVWRILDKYAVSVGGGTNNRMGLFDMVMIKDNHIAAHGSITSAVAAARRFLEARQLERMQIEVETKNLTEVSEALSCEGVSRIMFDNFPIDLIREAVVLVGTRSATEASGGITLRNVAQVAATGVQYISVGALTHSATALDISLDVV